jgi:hypothetical protein
MASEVNPQFIHRRGAEDAEDRREHLHSSANLRASAVKDVRSVVREQPA